MGKESSSSSFSKSTDVSCYMTNTTTSNLPSLPSFPFLLLPDSTYGRNEYSVQTNFVYIFQVDFSVSSEDNKFHSLFVLFPSLPHIISDFYFIAFFSSNPHSFLPNIIFLFLIFKFLSETMQYMSIFIPLLNSYLSCFFGWKFHLTDLHLCYWIHYFYPNSNRIYNVRAFSLL